MASVHDLTHQSGFIFDAELERIGASTASGYPAAAENAIVRVIRIIKSPPALSGYEGQRITVRLQTPVSLKVGQRAVFFTHGIHYGDGLVVNEIGSVEGAASALTADLSSALQASDDTDMTQRLAQAELVVSGVASAPKRYLAAPTGTGPVRRISEHDPDWWSSTITIDTVEKGIHSDKTTDVIFPNSMDVTWFRSPKVKEGDSGVWLLHNRDVFGRAAPALAVTHPLDFRPIEEVNRVRALLK
jgi:hypothetical protein